MKYFTNVTSLAYNREKCVGCGLCAEVCPHGVFVVRDTKAVIINRDRCMECSACSNNCAFGALSVDRGVGCAAALINSMITGGEPSCDCGAKNSSACC